jgi:hypothetical protein
MARVKQKPLNIATNPFISSSACLIFYRENAKLAKPFPGKAEKIAA